MNVTKWSLLTVVLSSCLFFSVGALAACTGGSRSGLTTITEMPKFDKDAPVGSVLGRVKVITSNLSFTSCNHSSDVVTLSFVNQYSPIGNGLFKLAGFNDGMQDIAIRGVGPEGQFPAVRQLGVGNHVVSWDGVEFEFVKIGPNVTSGFSHSLNGGPTFIYNNGRTIGPMSISDLVNFISDTSPTCSVTTPTVNVNMGSVSIADLTATGRSPARNFNIDLSCSGGTDGLLEDIFVTLTDQSDPANRSTQLGLTPGSTATGVVLEVNNSAGPVSFGPDSDVPGNPGQWFEGSSDNGVFTIPLSANYLQVSPTPTAGSANAVATYTLSYQ